VTDKHVLLAATIMPSTCQQQEKAGAEEEEECMQPHVPFALPLINQHTASLLLQQRF
jgi:hypothetical protein